MQIGDAHGQLPDSFLRLAKSWLLLPFAAYLFAIPALGPGAIFVPIVVAMAPLGVISFFDEVSLDGHEHQTAIVIIHILFWVLFVAGVTGRMRLRLRTLRIIWGILVISLIMSVSGCAQAFGSGLRNSGNWH